MYINEELLLESESGRNAIKCPICYALSVAALASVLLLLLLSVQYVL